jgi:site-specific recombinase XerD
MSPPRAATNVFERYDQALKYARDHNLPPDHPRPHSTCDWPPENRELLTRYEGWLLGGGTSPLTTNLLCITMAGHALGLFLKPHSQMDISISETTDLGADLQPAMEYVLAKRLSAAWTRNCRRALVKFRRFLCQERGILEVTIKPYDPTPHAEGLPDWLIEELKRYQVLRQRNWRTARLQENICRFWSGHLRTWRFLCRECGVIELGDLKRQHVFRYMEHRLKAGYAESGINGDVRGLHGFLGFLQDGGYTVPQALFRVPGLKEHQRLPKFLTDEQVRLLRDDLEARVRTATLSHNHRDALLDRAAFYLLWQAGLRLGEVEELRLEDLDLGNRRLSVRQSKGAKDRSVYLTDTVVSALRAYQEQRGVGSSDHVFLYRNRALCKDLIRNRVKASGLRVGVKVYPHRLRHTCATQLLNAGCRVTSIQRFLGHKRLNTTMVYAKVHDHKVAEDYYAAMEQVEKRLDLASEGNVKAPIDANERGQLLALTDQLAESHLTRMERMELAAQMRWLLNRDTVIE